MNEEIEYMEERDFETPADYIERVTDRGEDETLFDYMERERKRDEE